MYDSLSLTPFTAIIMIVKPGTFALHTGASQCPEPIVLKHGSQLDYYSVL